MKRQRQLTKPTVKIQFKDGTYKYWTSRSGAILQRGLTDILTKQTKEWGRAVGRVKVLYLIDPDGDYYTMFDFYNKEDCIKKIKPCLEKELLSWIYAED